MLELMVSPLSMQWVLYLVPVWKYYLKVTICKKIVMNVIKWSRIAKFTK